MQKEALFDIEFYGFLNATMNMSITNVEEDVRNAITKFKAQYPNPDNTPTVTDHTIGPNNQTIDQNKPTPDLPSIADMETSRRAAEEEARRRADEEAKKRAAEEEVKSKAAELEA